MNTQAQNVVEFVDESYYKFGFWLTIKAILTMAREKKMSDAVGRQCFSELVSRHGKDHL